MSATVAVNRLHFPVEVLGPGPRVGIWLQGCTIGCRGCASHDTWDRASGSFLSSTELSDAVDTLVGDNACDGITITGGEPFDQPEAVVELVSELRRRLAGRATDGIVDVLVFSGRPRRTIEEQHPAVVAIIDVLVPEPYIAGAGRGGRLQGSANQPVVFLTELGRARFEPWLNGPDSGTPAIQVAVDDDGIWMIGLPLPGDLDRLAQLMGDRGVALREPSWRP